MRLTAHVNRPGDPGNWTASGAAGQRKYERQLLERSPHESSRWGLRGTHTNTVSEPLLAMRGRSVKPAGRLETALFFLLLVVLGFVFLSAGIYAIAGSRGTAVGRLAVAITSVPVGLGLLYLGVGGYVAWAVEAKRKRA